MILTKALFSSALALGLALVPLAGAQASSPVSPAPIKQSAAMTPRPMIVGGSQAALSEAPYIAQVNLNGQAVCTGELVSPTWVLTAEHCTRYTYEKSVNLGSATKGQGGRIGVKRTLVWRGGDMALLELDRPYRGPVATLGKNIVPKDSVGTIFGFGRINAETSSPFLKQALVRNTGDGQDLHFAPAYRVVGITGQSWIGDSGGPLVVDGKVVGIASNIQGENPLDPRRPVGYSRVADAASWIQMATGVVAK